MDENQTGPSAFLNCPVNRLAKELASIWPNGVRTRGKLSDMSSMKLLPRFSYLLRRQGGSFTSVWHDRRHAFYELFGQTFQDVISRIGHVDQERGEDDMIEMVRDIEMDIYPSSVGSAAVFLVLVHLAVVSQLSG